MKVQEASESVIEMKDDDPDHFEIMLKFLYTNEYELSVEEMDAPQLVENFIHPVGVHLLADKYEIDGLCIAAANAFGCPDSWEHSDCCFKIDTDGLNQVVGVHYGACALVGSDMGGRIVNYMFRHCKMNDMAMQIGHLVHSFPAFGADIVIAELRLRCLGQCAKKHK